jgi:hypothetical protein
VKIRKVCVKITINFKASTPSQTMLLQLIKLFLIGNLSSSRRTVTTYCNSIIYDSELDGKDLKSVARLLSDTFDSVGFLLKWYSVLDYEAQLQQRIDGLIKRCGSNIFLFKKLNITVP